MSDDPPMYGQATDHLDFSGSMGSSSMAAGPGGKSALKVGEKVEQKAAGGCC